MNKIILLFLLLFPASGFSQSDNPLEYMEEINDAYKPVLNRQFDFARSLAQGEPPESVERQRRMLLKEIVDAKNEIRSMPRYKGNGILRDSTVSFLDITYNLVNEDYARIVSLESVAEQGYQQMEAFLQTQQEAYSRTSQAARGLKKAEEQFAKQFGVSLVDSDDKFARRLEELNRTFKYYNKVYLSFFRAYQQELTLFNAIENQSLDEMKTERRKLQVVAAEGLEKLNRMGSYNGDKSLRTAAQQNLKFYQQEATTRVEGIISYYTDLDELHTLKKQLDKPGLNAEQRRALTGRYNDQVKQVNQRTPELNELNSSLNLERARQLDQWNKVSESFLQKFIN